MKRMVIQLLMIVLCPFVWSITENGCSCTDTCAEDLSSNYPWCHVPSTCPGARNSMLFGYWDRCSTVCEAGCPPHRSACQQTPNYVDEFGTHLACVCQPGSVCGIGACQGNILTDDEAVCLSSLPYAFCPINATAKTCSFQPAISWGTFHNVACSNGTLVNFTTNSGDPLCFCKPGYACRGQGCQPAGMNSMDLMQPDRGTQYCAPVPSQCGALSHTVVGAFAVQCAGSSDCPLCPSVTSRLNALATLSDGANACVCAQGSRSPLPSGCSQQLINVQTQETFTLAPEGQACISSSSNACSPSPCFNGATCVLNGASFTCQCASGYIGQYCDETPPDPCDGVLCGMHGHCATGSCVCIDGFTGSSCQTPPADPCQAIGCSSHASCVNGQCVCFSGWEGPDCNDFINNNDDTKPTGLSQTTIIGIGAGGGVFVMGAVACWCRRRRHHDQSDSATIPETNPAPDVDLTYQQVHV